MAAGDSYVPVQQPQPIQSISFERMANGSVKVVCNGRETLYQNTNNVKVKTATRSDLRIVVKTHDEKMKYIFPLSALTGINGGAAPGTVPLAIEAIADTVFAGA